PARSAAARDRAAHRNDLHARESTRDLRYSCVLPRESGRRAGSDRPPANAPRLQTTRRGRPRASRDDAHRQRHKARDSYRSRRPRRAGTTAFLSRGSALTPAKAEAFAGGDGSPPAVLLKQQPTGIVEACETARKLAFGQAHV